MFSDFASTGIAVDFPVRVHLRFAALGLLLFSTNFTLFYYASPHLASGSLQLSFQRRPLNILMLACLTVQSPRVAVCNGLQLFIFLPELRLSAAALPALLLCIGYFMFLRWQSGLSLFAETTCTGYEREQLGYGLRLRCAQRLLVLIRSLLMLHLPICPGWCGWRCFHQLSLVLLTLVGRIGAGRAGYATVIFPVFALLISTFFEGYGWTTYRLLVSVLCCQAIF